MTNMKFFRMIDAAVFTAGRVPHWRAPELQEGEHVDGTI